MPALHLKLCTTGQMNDAPRAWDRGLGQRTQLLILEMATLLPKVLSTTKTLCTQKDQDGVHVCMHRNTDGPGYGLCAHLWEHTGGSGHLQVHYTQTKDLALAYPVTTPAHLHPTGNRLGWCTRGRQLPQSVIPDMGRPTPGPTNQASLSDQHPH